MWLLKASTKQLEAFVDNVPPYAILSHTWGKDEILFHDIMTAGACEDKAGWRKVDCTCRQALEDELEYVWIDNCCIDKSSSAELSEAINSMFKWYRAAEVCYVFLEDVNMRELTQKSPKFDSSDAFKDDLVRLFNKRSFSKRILEENWGLDWLQPEDSGRARWFTRAWTLQELIAPKQVNFYSNEWFYLGNKADLTLQISHATGVPQEVLLDATQMYVTSIACRMSWAARRSATRTEDLAYSLLGIFGVNMPMMYGEGEKAFVRLQEEIIKVSDDQSIFAWTTKDLQTAVLAPSPSCFIEAGEIDPIPENPSIRPYTISHKGLSINLPMLPTSAYDGAYRIHTALLQCQIRGDYTRQSVIYLRETTSKNVFARCAYRGTYTGSIALERGKEAKRQTVYLESPWRAVYEREEAAVVYLSINPALDKLRFKSTAKTRGVRQIRNRHGTYRLLRSQEAMSYDLALGFLLYSEGHSADCGYLIAVYYPHKSSSRTELCGVAIHAKPDDWPLQDWIAQGQRDMSLLHVQNVVSSQAARVTLVSQSDSCTYATQGIVASIEARTVLRQMIYEVRIDPWTKSETDMDREAIPRTVPPPTLPTRLIPERPVYFQSRAQARYWEHEQVKD